jgi:hypothetical protein
MLILSLSLYVLAVGLALSGIYALTLGSHFVVLGVLLYIAVWPTAWLARRVRPPLRR